MATKDKDTQSQNKRYSMDCREAGEGCSLKISGSYDEVLDAGTSHAIKAHDMKGEESKVREDIKSYIKEDSETGTPSFGDQSGEPRRQGQQPRPS